MHDGTVLVNHHHHQLEKLSLHFLPFMGTSVTNCRPLTVVVASLCRPARHAVQAGLESQEFLEWFESPMAPLLASGRVVGARSCDLIGLF